MKFCSMIITYNDEDLIGGCLDGLSDLFNIVLISTPWRGEHLKFDRTEEIAREKGAFVIKENFNIESDARNRVMEEAMKRGYDYVFIIDADEYWKQEDIRKTIKFIEENPAQRYNVSNYICLWKDTQWEIIPRARGIVPICYKTNLKFKRSGIRNINNIKTLKLPMDITLYHFSWNGSDKRIFKKLEHNSHLLSSKVPKIKEGWFKNVWKKWKPEMENIHPMSPAAFKKAIPFECPNDIKERFYSYEK